jgi:hypothetical protein
VPPRDSMLAGKLDHLRRPGTLASVLMGDNTIESRFCLSAAAMAATHKANGPQPLSIGHTISIPQKSIRAQLCHPGAMAATHKANGPQPLSIAHTISIPQKSGRAQLCHPGIRIIRP